MTEEKLNANARAVLDAVCTANNHPTAAEVYDIVRQNRPQIGLASVYRILHGLVEKKHIHELRYSDDSCRYDGHTTRHDHAICTHCGALQDIVDVELPAELIHTAAGACGFTVQTHELRIYGLCQQCQRQQTQA